MLNLFAWYLLVTLLGWLTFPLAWRLFPVLKDRGYSLARVLGLLVWSYVLWMMASLGLARNDMTGILLALFVLAAVSGFGLARRETRRELGEWVRSNQRVIIIVEVLFFLAFAVWTFVRASNPSIETAGGEKTMELAFINSILRSPTFPPADPWLSGYAISYYYFGYVMTALLARVTNTLASVAHNLMSALVFALSLIGAYGILYNLLAGWRKAQAFKEDRKPSLSLPLLGPLFLLFVSNLEGFLEVIHSRGLFWKFAEDGTATSAFWTWVGIPHLVNPPSTPLSWTPSRFIWWWQASRVIQDRFSNEMIDEFPAFSYLLGDLHPHVLAMPFDLLVVALALNLFLGGWKGETNLYFYKLPIRPAGVFFGALILGGLAFLNTWDILIGFGLVGCVYVLARALEHGWDWDRLKDLFSLCIPVGLLAIFLYLPFYAGFSSQAGGILPNVDDPTRGIQMWVMFAPLFLALFAFFVYLWRGEKRPANWKTGILLAAGVVVVLWLFSWLLGGLALLIQPEQAGSYLVSQCGGTFAACFLQSTLLRFSTIGTSLTLFGLLCFGFSFLTKPADREPEAAEAPRLPAVGSPTLFVVLLALLGTLLVLAPEFVFLRDLFTSRLNTIFKFYYQAWLVWSLAAAFGVAVLLQKLRGVGSVLYRVGLILVLVAALAFPAFGLPAKTNNYQLTDFTRSLEAARENGDPTPLKTALSVWTLDGAARLASQYPDDAAAAEWLLNAPNGVVAEAVSKDAYSEFGRMAAYSGQPTVIGWWWHEYQWRGSTEEQVSPLPDLACRMNSAESYDARRMRGDDISCLYEINNWEITSQVIAAYDIRYIVIGVLENQVYNVNETKFADHLPLVFESGNTKIYMVP